MTANLEMAPSHQCEVAAQNDNNMLSEVPQASYSGRCDS